MSYPPCNILRRLPPNINHTVLELCTSSTSLHQTQQSHALAITSGHLPHTLPISAALILHYATFHHLSTSLLLFHLSLPFSRSAFLYNTIIRANSRAQFYDEFKFYNLMIRSRVPPDHHTFPCVLTTCTDYNKIRKAFEVHCLIWKLGFGAHVFVGNTLIKFYATCVGGDVGWKVFDEMTFKDLVTWNTLIGITGIKSPVIPVSVCSSNAIILFKEMMREKEIRPNAVTMVSVLSACAKNKGFVITSEIHEIHGYVVKTGWVCNVTVCNALIDAYGKCDDLGGCKRVFEEMTERNEVSWNAVVTSLVYVGRREESVGFFKLMVEEGVVVNAVAVSSILPVLVELECVRWGVEVHGFSVRTGIECDVFVANSLLDMYAKFGYGNKALHVFNSIGLKNVVSWNTMVGNYAQNGFELLALDAVRDMQMHGLVPNDVTLTNLLPACGRIGSVSHGKEVHARSVRGGFDSQLFISNALIDMYAKCGDLKLARKVCNVSCKDRVSYNTLMSAYAHTSASIESLILFRELLLRGLEPDAISFSSALSACANMAGIKSGREIHGVCVRTRFYNNLIVSNSVLDLYTKCGRMDLAQKVFDEMPDKDVASWNTIILGYGMRGEIDTAISLFESMKDGNHDRVKRDSITYIAVLSACSHGGLVDLGRKYFEEMKEHEIEPTQMHYACMVDLLGRAGLMDEAVEMINGLGVEPDVNVWGSLLGACRIHGNIELGQWAADHIFKLKPGHSGYYMLLSNMYAEAGLWHEADKIRELMKFRGVQKNPGFSSVQQPHNS